MNIVCLDAQGICTKEDDLDIFKKFGNFKYYDATKPEEVIERLKDADIVITTKVLLTKEVLEKTHLKLICIAATGINNVDLKMANKLNIPIKNVANYSTNGVAQQAFASLLELMNKTSYYNDYAKNEWHNSPVYTHLGKSITEINGKKFGIIGLGHIGNKVAQIATAFGAEVCYYSTSGKNNNTDYRKVELKELLENCDIISIHAALNEKTKNLIAKNELELLKDSATIMNFGRGGIINENDLAQIADEKNLKIALDVLEKEPICENHPLLKVKKRDNIVITPHIAWSSTDSIPKLLKIVEENIENFLSNK